MSVEIHEIDKIFEEIAQSIDEDDPHKFHHHTSIDGLRFIKAQDNGIEVQALCGFAKKPDTNNPLRKPCCPKCSRLMKSQCLGKFYKPED